MISGFETLLAMLARLAKACAVFAAANIGLWFLMIGPREFYQCLEPQWQPPLPPLPAPPAGRGLLHGQTALVTGASRGYGEAA
eukprot:SAG22_NODE_2785_length_2211_cov_14.169981_1_plen_82_part_10